MSNIKLKFTTPLFVYFPLIKLLLLTVIISVKTSFKQKHFLEIVILGEYMTNRSLDPPE